MKSEKINNVAYIDGANLHNGVISQGWKLDYKRFRVWLLDKYDIVHAYIFIGRIFKYKDLYQSLSAAGFVLVFKEVVYDNRGKPKGNCDADLVLRVMRDYHENVYEKAVIVSSDGDYASLIMFLLEKSKLFTIVSPSTQSRCSILLKRTGAKITYINDQRSNLEVLNEKAPGRDETLQGSFS